MCIVRTSVNAFFEGTIIELHISANTHVDDYVTEVSVVCLDGDTDSAGYFAGFFFDLHNFIVDLIAV